MSTTAGPPVIAPAIIKPATITVDGIVYELVPQRPPVPKSRYIRTGRPPGRPRKPPAPPGTPPPSPPKQQIEPIALRAFQAARLVGLSPHTIRRMMRQGELEVVVWGRLKLVVVESLRRRLGLLKDPAK